MTDQMVKIKNTNVSNWRLVDAIIFPVKPVGALPVRENVLPFKTPPGAAAAGQN